MARKINLVFFCLVVLKAIVSIQSVEIAFEHDVTKQLDAWIIKILKINTDTAKKLFSRISLYKIPEYVYNLEHELEPFGNKLRFHDVVMNVSEFKSPQINWKFSENKMGIFIKEYTVRIMGKLRETDDIDYASFDTHLDLENVSFTLSINEKENTTQEFTQDHSWFWFNEHANVYWNENERLISNSKTEALEKVIEPVLKAFLKENFKNNNDFAKSMRTIFKAYSGPKKTLISTHAEFFTNDNKYYYLIPKIPFFCFNLKNIFVKGLWNLEWLKINTGLTMFTHTLMIRNVQGSLVLDYGSTQEKPVELQFKIDYFSISTDRKSVNVDARCYSVNKTNTPLTYRQSALIMQRIESAVAYSLFPSVENRRTYEIDTPFEQIKINDKTDWKTIKAQFNEWIPFNDDGTKPAGGAAHLAAAAAGGAQIKK